eukprot:2027307-Amphidinium_carterae.1
MMIWPFPTVDLSCVGNSISIFLEIIHFSKSLALNTSHGSKKHQDPVTVLYRLSTRAMQQMQQTCLRSKQNLCQPISSMDQRQHRHGWIGQDQTPNQYNMKLEQLPLSPYCIGNKFKFRERTVVIDEACSRQPPHKATCEQTVSAPTDAPKEVPDQHYSHIMYVLLFSPWQAMGWLECPSF